MKFRNVAIMFFCRGALFGFSIRFTTNLQRAPIHRKSAQSYPALLGHSLGDSELLFVGTANWPEISLCICHGIAWNSDRQGMKWLWIRFQWGEAAGAGLALVAVTNLAPLPVDAQTRIGISGRQAGREVPLNRLSIRHTAPTCPWTWAKTARRSQLPIKR